MQRGLPNHSQRRRDIKFAFDYVFDQYATQQEVYERTTKHLINEVLSGFNCTCFAYGATGNGISWVRSVISLNSASNDFF
jgi:kinesin family protein 18/19